MPDNIYCHPDSDILKNKLGTKSKDVLFENEIYFTANRLLQLQKKPICGSFDFRHLCRIHRYIFQDLYDWAGKPRTVDIGKGNLFCRPQYVQSYAADIFRKYAPECIAAKNNKDRFVKTLAEHYADLNALHPFREGNGRAQREFARELCLKCGYDFNLEHTSHREMLYASVKSFSQGDNSELESIFQTAVTPLNESKLTENRLKILSKDDIPENAMPQRGHEFDSLMQTLNEAPSKITDYDF